MPFDEAAYDARIDREAREIVRSMEPVRECRTCGAWKDLSEFTPSTVSGLRGTCRPCGSAKRRLAGLARKNEGYFAQALRLYGIDRSTVEAMIVACGNRCQICGQEPQAGKRLAIDHDHATGTIRGLLCDHCNLGVGCFRDDPARLLAAAAYLQPQ